MNKAQVIKAILATAAFHDEGEEKGIRWFIAGVESEAPYVLYGITAEKVLFSYDDDQDASACESQSFKDFMAEGLEVVSE